MPDAPLATVLRHLRRLADAPEPSDQHLLGAFAARRDPAAFAALVRRHGPLVLNVCLRVLRHAQDAEDAFQATFLVLARSAAAVRKGGALASWLHGVAYRMSLKARRSAARRRAHEGRAPEPLPSASPAWESAWREVQALLDEEVQRLPERLRAPFVLCCLEGVGRADAAGQLGVKEGTLSSRLAQARKELQRRLARRGVALTAVLAAAALAPKAGAVPASLLKSVVAAAGEAGAVPAHVLALAEGVTPTMFASKGKLATLLLLAAGLAAAGAVAASRSSKAAAPPVAKIDPRPAEAPKKAKAPAAEREAAEAVTVRGSVLGADGKPVSGAKVAVWSRGPKKKEATVRATTKEDGSFSVTVTAKEVQDDGVLIATAAGRGPDWLSLDKVTPGKKVELRLPEDDLPVTGTVLDLEGRPVAGVTVTVERLGKEPGGGDLKAWLDRNVAMRAKGVYINESGLSNVWGSTLGAKPVTTDARGRFTLAGLGRERVARLTFSGPETEHVVLWAVTRPGPKEGWVRGQGGVYAASFRYVLGPGKPIVGTVRDKRTKKPIAGVTVASVHGQKVYAVTDKDGRYRLGGVPKEASYAISAGGTKGVPYFDVSVHDVRDTPGREPIKIDFELERGVEVTGRLTDKATGKPARGWVQYFPLPTNPRLKDYETAFKSGFLVSDWGVVGADGAFTVLAAPGPGVLAAGAYEVNRFALLDAHGELRALGIYGWPGEPVHAVWRINPSEKDPKSLTAAVALEPGSRLTGRVVGPDGKPLAGAHVAGLGPVRDSWGRPPDLRSGSQGLKTAEFTAVGLTPTRPRALVFYHPEKKLGKVVKVRGDEKAPFTVRLDKTGAAKGRVVDEKGRPRAGLTVWLRLSNSDADWKSLSWWDLAASGLRITLSRRDLKTDAEGKFTVDGLVPGLPYEVVVGEGEASDKRPFPVLAQAKVRAESGKTLDLGDLKAKGATGEKEE